MEQKINHIAIIMDGNGRWAQQRGYDRIEGHKAGAKAVRRIVEDMCRRKIPYLTLYTFSTENWNRPRAEVNALMTLLVRSLQDELPTLIRNNVKLNAIGNLDDLPEACVAGLQTAMEDTAHCTGLTLTLALSYSGRAELTHSIQKIAEMVENQLILSSDITDNMVAKALYTYALPDPDILIRTGGEQRISNFLLWQLAYTELFFLPVMWPDFDSTHLQSVIEQFLTRERRFGKTSEQVQN